MRGWGESQWGVSLAGSDDKFGNAVELDIMGANPNQPQTMNTATKLSHVSNAAKEEVMGNSAMKTLRGDELPSVLADSFGDGKPDDVYVVRTRRLSAHDAAKLAALRADAQKGLEDIAAGRVQPFDIERIIGDIKRKRG